MEWFELENLSEVIKSTCEPAVPNPRLDAGWRRARDSLVLGWCKGDPTGTRCRLEHSLCLIASSITHLTLGRQIGICSEVGLAVSRLCWKEEKQPGSGMLLGLVTSKTQRCGRN